SIGVIPLGAQRGRMTDGEGPRKSGWRNPGPQVAHRLLEKVPAAPQRNTGGGPYVSHGLRTGTRALSKSLRSRVTTVNPCCRAVAAMMRSGCEKVSPVFRP